MLFGTREPFEYLLCNACGVLWLEQPPADLSAYYPDAYFSGPESADRPGPPKTGLRRWLHDERAARKLFGGHRVGAALARRLGPPLERAVRDVQELVAEARLRSFDDPILDVGSSPTPARTALLARAGFRNVLGIDPMLLGDSAYEGVRLRRVTLAELATEQPGRFGLITFHHSFEHVPDPRGDMLAAGRLLRPGGAVVIRTPMMGTWFWEKFGTSWWELDAPRHLFVHTPASLEIVARAAGLVLERVEFESSAVEVIASEQIARGIPWRDPRSWYSLSPSPEKSRELDARSELVRRLNDEGRGGRAILIFRRAGGAEDPTARMDPAG
jgi:SAM-dependent methyltransferase